MRARVVSFAAIALVSALAACGGGGGGGGGNPPPTTQPTATPTTSPAATPSYNPYGCDPEAAQARRMAVGVQPTTATGQYTYSGTLTETIVRSSPCPVGTSTATAGVSIDVAMSNGGNTETDTETDAYSTNTDEYQTTATVASSTTAVSGATVLTESSEVTKDVLNPGTSTTTTYGLGGQDLVYAVVSPVPYSGGAIANNPPESVDTNLADGSSENRTYADASGGYSETDVPAGGTASNTIAVQDNGAATYDLQTPSLSGQGVTAVNLSFSAPGSNGITVSAQYPGSSVPTPAPVTVPKWWTQSQLYSDQLKDLGTAKIPCSTVGDDGATSGEEYERVTTSVDPALGSLDTRTVDEYVVSGYNGGAVNVGPVCVTITDNESLFYDFFFDTPQAFYISADGKPFQTNSISESYWFSAPATGYARVREDASGVPGLAANVGAHVAGIAFRRSVERAQRIETAFANLRTYGANHTIQIKAIKGAL